MTPTAEEGVGGGAGGAAVRPRHTPFQADGVPAAAGGRLGKLQARACARSVFGENPGNELFPV